MQDNEEGTKTVDNLIDKADSFINDFEKTNEHTTIGNDIGEISIENKETIPEATQETTGKKSLSKLVKPKFAVNIIDFIIPTILVFILNRAAGYTVEKVKLQLDKDEKEALSPFVEDFLQTVQLNTDNPYTNLAIGICIVYGIRTIDVIPEMKRLSSEFQEVAETNIVKFEKEYNKQIERIMKEKKKKTVYSARKYFAEQEPALLEALIKEFEIEETERYINPTNEKEFTL